MTTSRSERRAARVEQLKRYCEQVVALVDPDFDDVYVYKPPGRGRPGEVAIQISYVDRTEVWRQVFVAGEHTGWARVDL